ncbi:hypothetical protein P12x_005085 [Tundrisphaera lichenicola]|uniref:hypothetical protein n=1 Tax=Tundrisphaera lichenicola TaxID=2029860 RepID=UPI003EB6E7D7
MRPEPDETPCTCISCRAMNPPGAEVCSGCGHRLRDPIVSQPPTDWLQNPYEAPRTSLDRMPALRIGTVMVLVAVFAVCLGAMMASPPFGVFISVGILPASIRTAYLADLRRSRGGSSQFFDPVSTFLVTFGAAYLVGFASLIAFGVTCFPIGLMTLGNNLNNPEFLGVYFGVGLGLVVAIFVAVWLSRFLLRAGRRGSGSDRFRDWGRGPQ